MVGCGRERMEGRLESRKCLLLFPPQKKNLTFFFLIGFLPLPLPPLFLSSSILPTSGRTEFSFHHSNSTILGCVGGPKSRLGFRVSGISVGSPAAAAAASCRDLVFWSWGLIRLVELLKGGIFGSPAVLSELGFGNFGSRDLFQWQFWKLGF